MEQSSVACAVSEEVWVQGGGLVAMLSGVLQAHRSSWC